MREQGINLLCQNCATSFRCSLHVFAMFCMSLKNKNIVKKLKNCLKTRDLTYYKTRSWRSGRVVEGAPLLRGQKTPINSLFSLNYPRTEKVAVSELSHFGPVWRVNFYGFNLIER